MCVAICVVWVRSRGKGEQERDKDKWVWTREVRKLELPKGEKRGWSCAVLFGGDWCQQGKRDRKREQRVRRIVRAREENRGKNEGNEGSEDAPRGDGRITFRS